MISPELKKADLSCKKNDNNHSPKRVNGWFGIEDRGGQNYVGHPRYLQKGIECFSFYIDKIVETIKKIVPKYDDNNIYNSFIFKIFVYKFVENNKIIIIFQLVIINFLSESLASSTIILFFFLLFHIINIARPIRHTIKMPVIQNIINVSTSNL